MSFLFQQDVSFPEVGANVSTVGGPDADGNGTVLDISQLAQAGFDFIRDPGAGFTAALEASVAGLNWTSIDALAASAQGTIAAHYNYVRINASATGAKGATTRLKIGGREHS